MGIKLLSLRLVPWCLHPLTGMGSYVSCLHLRPDRPGSGDRKIKLIKSDGVVKIYDKPIHVSELMLEFPKHMVCRSDSLYIGQKVPAMSESDQLQLGHNYFLLPKHFFQSVLSFVNLASFASSSSISRDRSKNMLEKRAASCRPFDIQKTPSGCLRIRVSEEFISQLMERQIQGEEVQNSPADSKKSKLCTTQQLIKEHSMLVRCSSMKWKPKLEIIREGRDHHEKKFSSFTMKRARNLRLIPPPTTTRRL